MIICVSLQVDFGLRVISVVRGRLTVSYLVVVSRQMQIGVLGRCEGIVNMHVLFPVEAQKHTADWFCVYCWIICTYDASVPLKNTWLYNIKWNKASLCLHISIIIKHQYVTFGGGTGKTILKGILRLKNGWILSLFHFSPFKTFNARYTMKPAHA